MRRTRYSTTGFRTARSIPIVSRADDWCDGRHAHATGCVPILFVDAAEHHHQVGSACPKRLSSAHIWNELHQHTGLTAITACRGMVNCRRARVRREAGKQTCRSRGIVWTDVQTQLRSLRLTTCSSPISLAHPIQASQASRIHQTANTRPVPRCSEFLGLLVVPQKKAANFSGKSGHGASSGPVDEP